MQTVHSDRLYGYIELPPHIQDVLVTPQFMRLQHIAHCSVPQPFSPFSRTANKLNHGVGTWHLGCLVEAKPEFSHLFPNIQMAAMLHDIGAPCLTHLMCAQMQKSRGKSHEALADEIIREEPLATCIKKCGGDIDTIGMLINGSLPPWSDVIAGPLDVDNADGIIRFGTTARFWPHPPCDPRQLVAGMTLKDNRIVFSDDTATLVETWLASRYLVMDTIHKQLARSDAMLWRAVDMAVGNSEIPGQVFRFNDTQIITWLSEKSGSAAELLAAVKAEETYVPVFERLVPIDCLQKANISVGDRTPLANLLALECNLNPSHVAVYMDTDRRYRAVRMASGAVLQHRPFTDNVEVRVFVHPTCPAKARQHIAKFMNEVFTVKPALAS